MRPTTALDDNVFDFDYLLHPGTRFEHPREVVSHPGLTLEGRKSDKEGRTFLHHGISARNFKRQFTLADHVEVKGARFENGLLIVDLVREIPEAMKPRRIAIGGPSVANQIEGTAA